MLVLGVLIYSLTALGHFVLLVSLCTHSCGIS